MILVVLPAYNEAASLKGLLPTLAATFKRERQSYTIYVVDDGSTDDTARVVTSYATKNRRVKLIRHSKNRGLAESINTGFREALKKSKSTDVLITMDSDNTHLPGLIMRMNRLIFEGHDIVICSRFTTGSRIRGVPLTRKLLSQTASVLFRSLFPIEGVKDYTSGFRAYRVGLVRQGVETYKNQFLSEKGFSCMVDILLKLRKFDPIVTEVPMILRYDLKKGKSKMNVGRTIADTLVLIGRYLVQ